MPWMAFVFILFNVYMFWLELWLELLLLLLLLWMLLLLVLCLYNGQTDGRMDWRQFKNRRTPGMASARELWKTDACIICGKATALARDLWKTECVGKGFAENRCLHKLRKTNRFSKGSVES